MKTPQQLSEEIFARRAMKALAAQAELQKEVDEACERLVAQSLESVSVPAIHCPYEAVQAVEKSLTDAGWSVSRGTDTLVIRAGATKDGQP